MEPKRGMGKFSTQYEREKKWIPSQHRRLVGGQSACARVGAACDLATGAVALAPSVIRVSGFPGGAFF